MGKAPRLHPSLPTPRNGGLARAPELLRGTHAHVEGARRCHCWRVFLSLTVANATTLIKKTMANQSWGEERKQQKGIHTMKKTDMLATKIDLLLSRLNERANEKEAIKATVQDMDSQMTCEVCGEVKHLGNNYLETHEDAAYINNGF